MQSDFKELASVDGTVTTTAEAMVPMKDDGLYRGDGAFEVIRLYGGRRIAATEPLPAHGESLRLATVPYSPSVILNGVKSLSYGANMHATRIAQEGGADEALLVRPDGIVLEAPTSTIFWVSPEGGLRTPAISTGILESITRGRIVQALHVEEAEFHIDDLHAAHEAFLASTVREVQPIVEVDGRSFEGPGPRTLEAKEAFERTVLEATT